MLIVPRKFLNETEELTFNKSNNFEITRYFNPNKLSGLNEHNFFLWFERTDKIIDSIKMDLIYFDTTKKVQKYQPVESIVTHPIKCRNEIIYNQNDIHRRIELKESTRILWKIIFRIEPQTSLKLTISVHQNG